MELVLNKSELKRMDDCTKLSVVKIFNVKDDNTGALKGHCDLGLYHIHR